uniref:Uncharacterized protein n=1 Tax=Arundo donax TaxID=35708 RepID=A0A0A8ZEW5_ARUDO
MVMLVVWLIWKHRNKCVFEGSSPCIPGPLARIRDEASLWRSAGAIDVEALLT